MNDMFKKVNAREKLIGWYHTGPKLRGSDLEINELFKRYTPNPLLVIIDVQPKEVGVPTDAYFAVEEIKDVRFPGSPLKLLYMEIRRVEEKIYAFNWRLTRS
jgi:26S proteasome regulatory subunit N8